METGKMKKYLRNLGQLWWVALGIVVVVLFALDQILLGVVFIVIIVLLAILLFMLRKRRSAFLGKYLKDMDRISERELARLSGVYVEEAHAFLHDISRNQKALGIAVLVKGEYIYFPNEIIKKFKLQYKDGKNTRDILEAMSEVFETREEVKQIIEKLREWNELPARAKKED
jgi:ABC-type multidrug transport system fused ATPase/permease subunit